MMSNMSMRLEKGGGIPMGNKQQVNGEEILNRDSSSIIKEAKQIQKEARQIQEGAKHIQRRAKIITMLNLTVVPLLWILIWKLLR